MDHKAVLSESPVWTQLTSSLIIIGDFPWLLQ